MQEFGLTLPLELAEGTTYNTKVLQLEVGQTEDSLDAQYAQQAEELGLEEPSAQLSTGPLKSISVNTLATFSSGGRRSASISSHNSFSTGLTSIVSSSSREYQYARPSRFLGRKKSPATPSMQEYDFYLQQRSSYSPSPPETPADSTISLSLDALRRPFSVRRGFSRFSILKRSSLSGFDSDRATCCQGIHKQRAPVYRLSCGHTYCASSLRLKVLECMAGGASMPPRCCRQPIAGVLIQAVITREEQASFLKTAIDFAAPWSDATSVASTVDSFAVTQNKSAVTGNSSVTNITELSRQEELASSLWHANSYPEFRALRQEQERERDRFIQYRHTQRTALNGQCESDKHLMGNRHKSLREELADRQSHALALIEDRHVAAEMDLRNGQEQELRNCLTAIRHMEAYCSGQHTSGGAPARTVTEQDKKELEKQYCLRDNLDQKHSSAINVLREQQAQRMKIRMQKQEAEMSALEGRHEQDLKSLEQVQKEELDKLEVCFAKRRLRMIARWNLVIAIWRKKLEKDAGVIINGRIPSVEWPTEGYAASCAIGDSPSTAENLEGSRTAYTLIV